MGGLTISLVVRNQMEERMPHAKRTTEDGLSKFQRYRWLAFLSLFFCKACAF